MLAEFKYGLVPKESFSRYVDQSKSNRYIVKSVIVEWVLTSLQNFLSFEKSLYNFSCSQCEIQFFEIQDLLPYAYWKYMVRNFPMRSWFCSKIQAR
jgi:hypothetical protein